MSLAVGDRIGPCEILAPIGAGGMGEVYRAHDGKLDRDVAIKVLPAALAQNPERLARFEREAKVLAALNHPNIAAIYGLEDRAIIMELVEGPTLAERLRGGGLPLGDALAIAQQIIAALEAAHDKGIVHRDLKPANVKAPPDGAVKVLDFGLATVAQAEARATGENSPTLTMAATEAGVILGTAAYMSPEQAVGKPVDRRADIWSFGVVLWEMLTGQRLFHGGETVSHTLADVLRAEIDFSRLPATTPVPIRDLLKRCLDRDVKTRLRDIGEARVAIQRYLDDPGDLSPAARPPALLRHKLWPAAAAILAAGLAAVSFLHFRQPPVQERTVRFQIPPPEKSSIGLFKLSPDGRYLAFIANEGGRNRLWVRPLDSLESRVLPGTDGANYPFWSPDSAFIGFAAQNKLRKVAVAGGPPQTLCDAPNSARGTWSADGVIVFAPGPRTPLQRVASSGGVPVALTKLGRPGENHYTPEFLPGSRRFLYTITGGKPDTNGIYAGSLDGQPPVLLLPDESNAVSVPPPASGGAGHLLFRREASLMAQPFDPATLRITGEMFPLADQVSAVASVQGVFSASVNGVLAYGTGASSLAQELVWMDRTGKQVASAGPQGEYNNFRLSPDEKKLAFDRSGSSNVDVWVLDMLRGVPSRLTSDPETDNLPIWSPDGLRVLFPSRRSGAFDLYFKTATGAGQEEPLVKMGTATGWGTDWSRDGRFILYQRPGDKTGQDLWIAPQFGDRKPYPYLATQFNEANGVFSPDARWIAYHSDESSRDEVYVQAFPLSSEKKRISTAGGTDPMWRKDGAELFYLAADRNLMAVPIQFRGAVIEPGVPKPLFPVPGTAIRRSYAVSNDGQRFLVARPLGETSGSPITVVLNWQAGVKK